FPEIPSEIEEKWLSSSKKSAPKTYQGIKKAIKTKKDFDEKIGDNLKKTIASFINPKFVSRSGHTYKNIMDKTRQSMNSAGKNYIWGVKDVFETGRYEKKVADGQNEYSRKWCQYIGPMRGYHKGGIKGLSALGVMVLCGDPQLKNFLKERIDAIEGTPCTVIDSKKPIRFKRILANRIVHWGSEIIRLGFEAQDITRANEELNQLVNEYLPDRQSGRSEEIIPFTSGGVSPRNNRDSVATSHIDFIVVSRPGGTDEKIKQLGLEIQIALTPLERPVTG
ncbi:MAG: hypothetical protein V1709_10570, partial [Planctomycetota bacterium]